MTLDVESASEAPLNPRQKAFARELGIAMARGDRDFTKAFAAAGYAPDRGNAARLAADPRVKAIAEKACEEALRLAGLHIGYLQAKALELLHASATKIFRSIKAHQALHSPSITPEQMAGFDAALDEITWPLSEFKIDKDGVIAVKLPDKKSIIEMLAKQLGVGKDDSETTVNSGAVYNVFTGVSRPDQPREAS
jgi:hypothetical protein